MKITGISRKISHGNFANTSLFAEIEEGDDLQECYNDLTKKNTQSCRDRGHGKTPSPRNWIFGKKG